MKGDRKEMLEYVPQEQESCLKDLGQWSDKWCLCDVVNRVSLLWIYKGLKECDCGVKGQHYHCPNCGAIAQMG